MKCIPGDYLMKLVERMSRGCKAVIKAKGGYLKNLKYKLYFDLFNTFLVTKWFHMCYFIVLMSSLLFYNVEYRKSLEWVGVLNLLTGSVCIDWLPFSFSSSSPSCSCWHRGRHLSPAPALRSHLQHTDSREGGRQRERQFYERELGVLWWLCMLCMTLPYSRLRLDIKTHLHCVVFIVFTLFIFAARRASRFVHPLNGTSHIALWFYRNYLDKTLSVTVTHTLWPCIILACILDSLQVGVLGLGHTIRR